MELRGHLSDLLSILMLRILIWEQRGLFDVIFSLEVIRIGKLILLLTRVLWSIGLRGLENEVGWRLLLAINLRLLILCWLTLENLGLHVVAIQSISWDTHCITVLLVWRDI